MPAGDRTGPWGAGPMTGRGAGYCAGYPIPGYMNPIGVGFGRGFGRGRGGGRGYRHRFYATGLPGWAGGYWAMAPGVPYGSAFGTPAAHEELEVLKSQAKYFESALEDIKKRMQELETAAAAEEK